MRTQVVTTNPRTVVAVFDKGEEVMEGLHRLAGEHHLTGASFTAIGAFRRAVLGYFDRQKLDYEPIPVDEQVEVLSLIGDVALDDGEPAVHAHVVVGRHDGTTRGGHLLRAEVWPTLEVVVREVPEALHKRHDRETGLALIDPAASRDPEQ